MKTLLTTLFAICILAPTYSHGQDEGSASKTDKYYSNTLKQFFGNFYIRNSRGIERPLRQIGFYYERKVHRQLYAGAGYMQWVPLKGITDTEVMAVREKWFGYVPVVGELEYRSSYKMLDGYLMLKKPLAKRHILDIGAGVSYCWGVNAYLLSYIQGTPLDAEIMYESRKADYWGFVPSLSYNYLLFKNRMTVGADLKARYYSERPKAQYDYGLHIGFNF